MRIKAAVLRGAVACSEHFVQAEVERASLKKNMKMKRTPEFHIISFFFSWNKQPFRSLSLISHIWVHLGTLCSSGNVCKYPSSCQRAQARRK